MTLLPQQNSCYKNLQKTYLIGVTILQVMAPILVVWTIQNVDVTTEIVITTILVCRRYINKNVLKR